MVVFQRFPIDDPFSIWYDSHLHLQKLSGVFLAHKTRPTSNCPRDIIRIWKEIQLATMNGRNLPPCTVDNWSVLNLLPHPSWKSCNWSHLLRHNIFREKKEDTRRFLNCCLHVSCTSDSILWPEVASPMLLDTAPRIKYKQQSFLILQKASRTVGDIELTIKSVIWEP